MRGSGGAADASWAHDLPDLVAGFVAKGARVNRETTREPLLHMAARRNHVQSVRALLQHGADTTAIYNADGSALDVALEKGYTEVVALLGGGEGGGGEGGGGSGTAPADATRRAEHEKKPERSPLSGWKSAEAYKEAMIMAMEMR